jgi:hypothetical protein
MKWAIAIVAFLIACEGPAVKPATGPGTEYPCGVRGISCGNHMCCWEGDECGSDRPGSTCPADMCCWVGTPGGFSARRTVTPYHQIQDKR